MKEIITAAKKEETTYSHEINYFDNILWVRYGSEGVCGVGLLCEEDGNVFNMPLWSNNDAAFEKTTRQLIPWDGTMPECIDKCLSLNRGKIFVFKTTRELFQYAALIISEAEARENNKH